MDQSGDFPEESHNLNVFGRASMKFAHSEPHPNERASIFVLQFLIWWSLWTMLDSLEELLKTDPSDWFFRGRLYAVETFCGSIIFITSWDKYIGKTPSRLIKFLGLVILCSGLWGLVHVVTLVLHIFFTINPNIIRVLVLVVASVLGALHHFKYREDYLLDQLL
jgi:hypothetical protein